MAALGYTFSSEEFGPRELVGFARRAEEAGFDFALDLRPLPPLGRPAGQQPVRLGGHSGASPRRPSGSRSAPASPARRRGSTPRSSPRPRPPPRPCSPGRFFFGVGSGENLNEHILGDRWPETEVRQERLEEAVEVMRVLWQGGLTSHPAATTRSRTLVYTRCPRSRRRSSSLPPGEQADRARGADRRRVLRARPGRRGNRAIPLRRRRGQADATGRSTSAGPRTEAAAKSTALKWWPNAVAGGNLNWELPLPSLFEDATEWADEDDNRREHRLRPGSRSPRRSGPGVRRRGLRPRVPPSGRARPGGVLSVLRTRPFAPVARPRRPMRIPPTDWTRAQPVRLRLRVPDRPRACRAAGRKASAPARRRA